VREDRPNRQGVMWGWRSPRMEVAAVIQCKIGDGGGAPVTGAGQTAHGRMGGLSGAPKRRELT
jgi:hypothetical protein